jgi:RNA polymerase sigma-70 factor, ECF subfamily
MMPRESPFGSPAEFLGQYARVIRALHEQAGCSRWGLSREAFAESLRRSAAKRFSSTPALPHEVEEYLKSLHLEDLALACACGEGIEGAWEFFIFHFREDLRHAACTMLRGSGRPDDARAEELADSLHAELYGIRSGPGRQRKSLFEYFHGRSKLSTWLRAVLAQKHVDFIRTSGKTVSLDEDEETDEATPHRIPSGGKPGPVDPQRARYLGRFSAALSAALASLSARERMILACYYVDEITLAEIGKVLKEHESTVSRRLDRIRRALREKMTEALQREIPACNGRPAEPALDAAQVELALEYALEDWPFDLSRALLVPGPEAEQAKD